MLKTGFPIVFQEVVDLINTYYPEENFLLPAARHGFPFGASEIQPALVVGFIAQNDNRRPDNIGIYHNVGDTFGAYANAAPLPSDLPAAGFPLAAPNFYAVYTGTSNLDSTTAEQIARAAASIDGSGFWTGGVLYGSLLSSYVNGTNDSWLARIVIVGR